MQPIIHGKHFSICDTRGDMTAGVEGLYAHDVRYLSRWLLHVDGRRPQPLGEAIGPHHERKFRQRNIAGDTLPSNTLMITRDIIVGDGLYERLTFTNLTSEAVEFEFELEVAADFSDIFQVKKREFAAQGQGTGGVGLAGVPEEAFAVHHCLLGDDGHAVCTHETHRVVVDATQLFSQPSPGVLVWRVELAARGSWQCDVRAAWHEAVAAVPIEFDRAREIVVQQAVQFVGRAPRLHARDPRLEPTYETSLADLAALRIAVEDGGPEAAQTMLPAAGMPWFMTTFGRDTLITCLQTMTLGAERAEGAVRYLAALQATIDDPDVDAEPGKIVHEIREGAIAERGYGAYYGSVDSTLLFLITVHEIYQWTNDAKFVHDMRDAVMAAVGWLEHFSDSNADGYVDYLQRSRQGLENQSWKDSHDSQRFRDGRQAAGAIAPVEVQGYAYDARLRIAELASDVWKDDELAERLRADAADLRARFGTDFWVTGANESENDPRAAGYFALALDGEGRRVDTLCSNIGHLLWSGIVDEERQQQVVDLLACDELSSGWGIRTMATDEVAYNPIAYHNGTVWPHDTSLCVAGLVRAGAHDNADSIADALFEAAGMFDGRLPELFAGIERTVAEHPLEYPTASRPQAWAAATPIFLLQLVLGVQPDLKTGQLAVTDRELPEWLDHLDWRGIPALGARWNISVRDRRARVERAED